MLCFQSIRVPFLFIAVVLTFSRFLLVDEDKNTYETSPQKKKMMMKKNGNLTRKQRRAEAGVRRLHSTKCAFLRFSNVDFVWRVLLRMSGGGTWLCKLETVTFHLVSTFVSNCSSFEWDVAQNRSHLSHAQLTVLSNCALLLPGGMWPNILQFMGGSDSDSEEGAEGSQAQGQAAVSRLSSICAFCVACQTLYTSLRAVVSVLLPLSGGQPRSGVRGSRNRQLTPVFVRFTCHLTLKGFCTAGATASAHAARWRPRVSHCFQGVPRANGQRDRCHPGLFTARRCGDGAANAAAVELGWHWRQWRRLQAAARECRLHLRNALFACKQGNMGCGCCSCRDWKHWR